jgi:hypothetical protein
LPTTPRHRRCERIPILLHNKKHLCCFKDWHVCVCVPDESAFFLLLF